MRFSNDVREMVFIFSDISNGFFNFKFEIFLLVSKEDTPVTMYFIFAIGDTFV